MTDRRLIPTNSAKYKRARAAFYRRQGRWGWCALCGEVIDMLLSGRLANGRSIDHKVATSAGGAFFDESNWQLAHRRCNAAKGRGEALGTARPAGAPVPGDPRYCWKFRFGEWGHYHPDHGGCEWPDCQNPVHQKEQATKKEKEK